MSTSDVAEPLIAAASADSARVLHAMRLVTNLVRLQAPRVESLAGVTTTQMLALRVIQERAGIGVGDLARALGVQQPAASACVKVLVQKGWIEAIRAEPDRRAVQLRMLPAGTEFLIGVPDPVACALQAPLAEMNGQVLTALGQALDELLSHMGAGAAADPPSP